MSEYYDRKGNPMTSTQWANSFTEKRDKRVAKDTVNGHDISTVWLGLNHQWGDGPPLIFETMVFGGPLDQETRRYSTEEEALEGHAAMVERVKKADTAWLAGEEL